MKREILLRGSSESNADMLYFTGVFVPDPFFAFTLRGKKCALLGALELGRAKRTSTIDEFFDLTSISASIPENERGDEITVLGRVLRRNRVRALLVPRDFPAYCLERLRADGFDVKVSEAPVFNERAVKDRRELAQIEKANGVAAAGFQIAEEILRDSTVSGDRLIWRGRVLTSEILRSEIEKIALSLGADAVGTVVAAGNQACDPHEVGHGAIAPRSLIVMDIFPRLRSSGYFGDMTRTFIKGQPNRAQTKLVETVLNVQRLALASVRAGVNGADIHDGVDEFFASNGYFTECKNGAWSGFFHSTGHGVGLEIHERGVSISPRDCILKEGNVVTVEPGLYYRGVGGCRIEDTVVVRKSGAKLLSNYHYNWVV